MRNVACFPSIIERHRCQIWQRAINHLDQRGTGEHIILAAAFHPKYPGIYQLRSNLNVRQEGATRRRSLWWSCWPRHIKDNKAYLRLLSSGTPLSTAHLGISAAYHNLIKESRKSFIHMFQYRSLRTVTVRQCHWYWHWRDAVIGVIANCENFGQLKKSK